MFRHDLLRPTLAGRLGAAARHVVLALMVVVVVLQGLELSVQRGAGRAHIHLAEGVEPSMPVDTDHEQAHARGLAHDHDETEAGVLYLDEDHRDPTPSNPLPRASDLDKLLPPAAARLPDIERETVRADTPPLIRSVVIAPAERPPAA